MTQNDQPLDAKTHQLLVRVAHGLIAIVGVIVLVVSSYYLRRYAINTGMPEWLAWTLFVALDAGGTAGTLCWLLATGPARTWGRAIALANLTGSILGNILGHLIEAQFIPVTPALVILTGVVYPAELWALVHLGIQLRAEGATDQRDVPEVPKPLPASTPTTPTPQQPNTAALSNPLAPPAQASTPTSPPRPPTLVQQPRPRQSALISRDSSSNSRHRKVTPDIETRIRGLWDQGLTLQEVMKRSGYKRSTVMRIKNAKDEVEKEDRERVAS